MQPRDKCMHASHTFGGKLEQDADKLTHVKNINRWLDTAISTWQTNGRTDRQTDWPTHIQTDVYTNQELPNWHSKQINYWLQLPYLILYFSFFGEMESRENISRCDKLSGTYRDRSKSWRCEAFNYLTTTMKMRKLSLSLSLCWNDTTVTVYMPYIKRYIITMYRFAFSLSLSLSMLNVTYLARTPLVIII